MVDQVRKEVKTTANGRGNMPVDRPIELSDNARTVLSKRYLRRGLDSKPTETIEEMFWRVAWNVAVPEDEHNENRQAVAEQFYDLLTSKKFFPNSPTFTGAGTPLGQLAACFVLSIDDDMGRTGDGIFQTLRNAALIQQTGGGNGFSFSRLRPKGAIVRSSGGVATGPIGFLRVYDQAFGEVSQGGCLLPETLVFTDRGLLRLDELVDTETKGWQTHSLQVATDAGLQNSPHGYNNGIAPVMRVHTREGISLAGTFEHRVKVMTPKGPQWRTLKDLRKGDWILVRLGEHRGQLQSLRHPRRVHANQRWPKLPEVIDQQLAFFLGYLAGDGFISSGNTDHRVGVSVAHKSYLLDEMPQLLDRLFGVAVHCQQNPDDRSVTFVIDNRSVKEFLLLNELNKSRSRNVSVPRLIRQSPPEIIGAYLRGLFEADGGLVHGYPTLSTTSSRLAEEVTTLLIGLGCPVNIRSTAPGVNHYDQNRVYRVRIASTKGLQVWRERIGCDLRSRFVDAYAWESDQGRESVYTLPEAEYWVRPVLDAVTLGQIDRQGRGMGRKFRSTTPRLRRTLLRYLRGDRQYTRSAYDELCQQYPEFGAHAVSPEGCWFVRVSDTEEIGEALTLDLEVEEHHTYLAFGVVTHNTRRGANMGVLRVDHPDIREFITCKTSENNITNFNISVGVTDAFMQAVRDDKDFNLVNPQDGTVWETVKAHELFKMMVRQAHHNGEPGILFLDAANRDNPVPHLYTLESTNPCGEQYLGPFENCCLGSINLAQHVTAEGKVDWKKLRESAELSVRFLDDVVDANAYVPAVPELELAAKRVRRIGLGIMGLADLMYHLGIRYGGPEGQDFASQVIEFVHYHAMKTSIELARKRGSFLAIRGSIFDPQDLKWQPPQSLVPSHHDWGRPSLDWKAIVKGIKQHGIRNGAQTTIAPTGTISTVAGCEGYGCEPVFALAYIRHFNDNGKDVQLQYTSPLFEKALIDAGLSLEKRQRIVEQVNLTGSCQDVADVPESIRHVFVVASDITAEEHVHMQAVMQRFTSNAISKTCNFPPAATEEDVAKAYMLAWELGCKGLTVYVAGSREKVVLETRETAQAKQEKGKHDMIKEDVSTIAETAPVAPVASTETSTPEPLPLFKNEVKRPRARVLKGYTYRVETPLGTTFVTVNENGGDQPFELFMHTSKAGSDTAAVSEAMGRLISYILRMNSPIEPRKRLREVVRQMEGIGGGRSLGLGPNRVRSLPDGIAQVLDEYLHGDLPDAPARRMVVTTEPGAVGEWAGGSSDPAGSAASGPAPGQMPLLPVNLQGDLCPECGQAAVVNEEGCRKCYACGYSEC